MFAGLSESSYGVGLVAGSTGRPVALTVAGWCTMVVGALLVLASIPGMILSSSGFVGEVTFAGALAAPIEFMFRHIFLMAFLQFVIGGVLLLTGRYLLAKRRWAARVVEGAVVLGLGYLLFFTAFFLEQVFRMPTDGSPTGGWPIRGIMVVCGVLNALFWATPLTLAFQQLRTDRIRAVLQ